jgi:hypothetical protein
VSSDQVLARDARVSQGMGFPGRGGGPAVPGLGSGADHAGLYTTVLDITATVLSLATQVPYRILHLVRAAASGSGPA